MTLPSGRLRLLTSPASTGSRPVSKTTGILLWLLPWPQASRGRTSGRGDHGNLTADKLSRQRRQSVGLTISPNKFDCDVATLVKAHRAEALSECGQTGCISIGCFTAPNIPITGIACCARATIGQTAEPPTKVMKSRRLIAPSRLNSGHRSGSNEYMEKGHDLCLL